MKIISHFSIKISWTKYLNFIQNNSLGTDKIVLTYCKITIPFRLIIADCSSHEDDGDEMRPANLGELYQNQESDPQVQRMMIDEWAMYSSDELPDLP